MLSRLEVGLADEGVRVVHAVPYALADQVGPGIHAAAVGYFDGGWALGPLIRGKARDLIARVQQTEESEESLDVVHAFGQGTWRLAAEIARQSRAALMIEVWRASLMAPAAALVREIGSLGLPRVGLIVGEQALVEQLRQRVPTGVGVSVAAWGVHVPERGRSRTSGEVLGVGILSESGDARSVVPALTGLRDATRDGPETMIFADVSNAEPMRLRSTIDRRAVRTREAGLWSAARKLGLLDRLSLTPEMEARREPILQADLLLLPEPTGAQRTLVLEAMAAGVAVVSVIDDGVSVLNDATCVRVPRSDAAGWSGAIASILRDGPRRSSIAESARAYVRQHRSASSHIAGVLRAYEAGASAAAAS